MDETIIQLIIEHDEKGLKMAIDKYNSLCFSVAFNILKNSDDTEECLNDVWLILWNHSAEINPDHLKAFLIKTTRNQAIDHYRKNRSLKRSGNSTDYIFDQLDKIIPSDLPSMSSYYLLIDEINSFLKEEDYQSQYVFIHRYIYFDDIKTISKDLGINYFRTYYLLKNITIKMRKHLKDWRNSENEQI